MLAFVQVMAKHTNKCQAIIWFSINKTVRHHMASLGHNELQIQVLWATEC